MVHTKHAMVDSKESSLTEEERKQQTRIIVRLFEHWNLTYKQQAIMLGLSPNTLTSIYYYKHGKRCLPEYRDMQERVENLLVIHKYLRQAYPFNKELVYRWMTTPNADFNSITPFDIISKEGYMGLVRIRNYLELNKTI
ncbi:hypothetical protein AYO45_01990 [Gammaproteobacteria bacterium SCGC AG-212-F23]|nr:hypothetical protein AYO45_01990 [Gammaproteobacteria bacterium SCGC AG-212-F23]